MDELLERLCAILDRELERQENVQGLCEAQQAAIRARCLPDIEARTAALQLLIKNAVQDELERHRVLHRLVALLELPAERQTLSDIICAVPEPWKARLQYYQARLQSVMHDTRHTVRDTSMVLRRSLRAVNQCLQVFQEAGAWPPPYTEHGHEGPAARRPAVLINERG
jgi:hypothetical protein